MEWSEVKRVLERGREVRLSPLDASVETRRRARAASDWLLTTEANRTQDVIEFVRMLTLLAEDL